MAENQFPEEGERVLCTVRDIHGTTVFVELDKYQKTGVIATSEIAPGRIRNIRDYVVPQKKIVCMVLRIDQAKGHIDLSLRRVSKKDTQEELQKYKNENVAFKILELVLKEKTKITADKILSKNSSVFDLLESSRSDPSILEGFMNKEEASKISKIFTEKIKTKRIIVKTGLSITSIDPEGIKIIKDALNVKDAKVSYLGAPNYSISVEDKDYKSANKRLATIIVKVTEALEKKGAKVEVLESK